MPLKGPREGQREHVTVMEGIGAHWTPPNGAVGAEVEGPNRTPHPPVRVPTGLPTGRQREAEPVGRVGWGTVKNMFMSQHVMSCHDVLS